VCPGESKAAQEGRNMFEQLVISSATPGGTNKTWTVVLSAIGQSLLLAILILIPLIYTEALPNALMKTLIVAPPPPAAPQALPARNAAQVRIIPLKKFLAPAKIPARIAAEVNEPPTLYVEGGSASGNENNALRELLRPTSPVAPPAPVEPRPQRIRQGGEVEDALLVNRVVPEYPAIARTAHVSGMVVLHAIISKEGAVKELTYVSGPPLLVKAAMDAVRQWRYRPTMLDGEPVEVETTIQVVFNLGE